ncbi:MULTISPECIES: proline dehydrogenase family protein [unclassified Oceanobacillus]|uniref:proline dehydrogenase family protein n=1 Tax=unclassified Oceanobacillus TaxID=2630292 RepID=UPI0012EBF3AD|nr:proline dehydrogenase family protein [Oceanobacillus sp. AG]
MVNLTRDFFIALSNNQFLNDNAKRWGFRLGAEKFVAGTDLPQAAEKVKELNERGIAVTLDNLGEFVNDRTEAEAAKNQILEVIEYIHEERLNGHLSVKLTQVGLDIDKEFCMDNMREILTKASEYDIFVNIDMEKYIHYQPTLDIVKELHKDYENVGTVMQTYLYRTMDDLKDLEDVRLRIVKGAYKESEEVAFQEKEDIDANFMEAVKIRLQGNAFTSIATHDHNLIENIKKYVEEHQIDKRKFEFQMLYGFRVEMQYALAEEGYNFCTYIPFGDDWYGYFMRRLAERPQNINLVLKDTFYTEDNRLKTGAVVAGAAGIATLGFIAGRKSRKNK